MKIFKLGRGFTRDKEFPVIQRPPLTIRVFKFGAGYVMKRNPVYGTYTGNNFEVGYIGTSGTSGMSGWRGMNNNEPFYVKFLHRDHKGRKYPKPR